MTKRHRSQRPAVVDSVRIVTLRDQKLKWDFGLHRRMLTKNQFLRQKCLSMHPYASIPELNLTGSADGVVRIPVEQDVTLTPRIRAILDTREFQRLRQITQLALASRVYPGAVHSRFEHALGVYHNSQRYLLQLGRDPRFADAVSVHEAEVLMVAALLHDIGHWPFCHPIEDLELENMPPHESFASEYLGPNSQLTEVLESEWNITAEEIQNVLTGKSRDASLRLRQSILSGPIDIDKMDYLIRDSQHCGVPYGRNFDRSRLINSLIVNEAGDGLAVSAKGKTAAEMMVFARYVMFSEVYWHHTVRCATTMFARSFFELSGQLDLQHLFRLTEPEMIEVLRKSAAGTQTESLTEGLFGSRRVLHKRLREYSLFQNPELYRSLRQMNYSQIVECSNRLAASIRQRIPVEMTDVDILIDAPPVHREVEFKVDIHYANESAFRPLKDVSPIVASMSVTTFDDCVKRVRICVAQRLLSVLPSGETIDQLVADAVQQTG